MHELQTFLSKKAGAPEGTPAGARAQLSSSALSLTVDDGVVSSKCRVEESLKGAGFLNGHGELRSRGGVKTLTCIGSDCDDVATACLLVLLRSTPKVKRLV